MSSKQQSQCDERTSGMEKSAGKGKQSNQPLANDEWCNANAKLVTPKKELISKNNKTPHTRSLWFMVRLFVVHADREDLIWLDNLIKDFENNGDSDVVDRSVDLDKDNENENLAKQLLKLKLSMNHGETEIAVVSPTVQPYGMRFVFQDADGQQLIISRETVKFNLTKNYVKPVTEGLSLTPSGHISYDFITRLINWDDRFSHLRGISPKQIHDYVNKFRQEGCYEKINIEFKKMEEKNLIYKKRGSLSVKKQLKIASMYR
ncbi:unnamed protein product [Macrosiphum euphorbiae]|uniref:Uncharacterized protein n=1 Tax=Macrosiphum euphorbiae TaxID=13131 RepID=A0AAV0W9R0_9HEMI|nr:unnamed protein product [Macrosiphum euphorbiae]